MSGREREHLLGRQSPQRTINIDEDVAGWSRAGGGLTWSHPVNVDTCTWKRGDTAIDQGGQQRCAQHWKLQIKATSPLCTRLAH